MPSPFPGMDPFLEHPVIFPGLHDRLINNLSDFLQARLPAPYYADIGDRVWVEVARRLIGPDVNVLRREEGPRPPEPANGGVAVATATRTKPLLIKVPHDERREPFVEIYSRLDNTERLVTTVEVLSPSNKRPGEQGRALYLRKQQEVLRSQVHLVEIDLLRGGENTTAVPPDLLRERAGAFDYHVCVHPYDTVEDFLVYAFRLEERLPEFILPLLPGDPPVVIDLQAVFDRCYDTGPYRRRVRYADRIVEPPLRPDQATWAEHILREKGLLGPAPGG